MEAADVTKNVEGQENDPNVGIDVTDKQGGREAIPDVRTDVHVKAISSANADSTTQTRKWGLRLPSLPILKILQGIFFLLMIGQNVPGPHKKFWPFHPSNDVPDTNNKPLSPFYVEMRSDLYGHERQFPADNVNEGDGGLMRLLFGRKQLPPLVPSNTGIPNQQNIVLTLMNREYESYRYSVQAATTSKVLAAREFGQVSFHRALGKVLFRLSDRQDKQRLAILEERFLEEAGNLVDKLVQLRALLVNTNTTFGLGQCKSTNTTSNLPFGHVPSHQPQCDINAIPMSPQLDLNANVTNLTLSMIQTTNNMLKARVVSFVKEITDSLPPGAANAIKDTLLGHCSISGFSSMVNDLRKSPMRLHFSARKKRLFVTHVLGDLFASAVSALRREVTAIVRNAESGDEVLVVLQSAGGTVTGYGLLTAQLLRIKDAGLKLTIAVEQVAASGGYMAASVGDVIFCSPFAVVGSIGVLQEMPNFYERLKREGVQFHQITAGDFKRVLSLTKEATPEDLKKAKEDVEDVWKLFKDFVAEQRPSLKMDLVATGEVWFGKRALEVGLCDAIQVSDDVLTDFMDRGYDVYRVKYEEPVEKLFENFWNLDKVSAGKGNTLGLLLHWFLQKVVSLLQVDVGTDSTYKETLESWNTILLV